MQDFIQEILKTDKYSEEDTANCIGVSRETIRRIKIGKTHKASYDVAKKIISLYFSLKQQAYRN